MLFSWPSYSSLVCLSMRENSEDEKIFASDKLVTINPESKAKLNAH